MSNVKVQVVPFSGQKEDWSVWRFKFLGHSLWNKFANILKGRIKVPSENHDELDSDEVEIIENHDNGFTDLLMAMEDPVLVKKSPTVCLKIIPTVI